MKFYIRNYTYNDLFYLNPGITVGLIQTYYNTPEIGGPLSVCVQMFAGNLERNVSLTLTTSDGTAIGTTFGYEFQINGTISSTVDMAQTPWEGVYSKYEQLALNIS